MLNIFNYLDYRCYLNDFYKEQKAKSLSYSFNYFARKAGFKSKSFFHEVISGKKNLSKDSVFALQRLLNLNDKSFSYFEALVQFNQTKDPIQKEHFLKKLFEDHKFSAAQLIRRDQYDYFGQWHHSTIRELIGMFDFKEDYGLLARLVCPPITKREAKKSVKLLEHLGLIRKAGKRYEIVDKSLTTGDEVKSIAVKKYHAENLNLAINALYSCSAKERDISSIVGALSNRGFATVKQEIQQFRKKIMEVIDKDKDKRKVFAINFQLLPTSEEIPE
jgi:uncharacterized protein (TIGR02147 family)